MYNTNNFKDPKGSVQCEALQPIIQNTAKLTMEQHHSSQFIGSVTQTINWQELWNLLVVFGTCSSL
jgi:hypothetical protein